MEDIYKVIVYYMDLHPLQFWTGIVLILVIVSLIFTLLNRIKKFNNRVVSGIIKPEIPSNSLSTSPVPVGSSTNDKKDLNDKSKNVQKLYVQVSQTKDTCSEESNDLFSEEKIIPDLDVNALTKNNINDPLPPGKVETEKASNEILKVDYTSSLLEQTGSYPIYRYPKQNTVVRSYRVGSTKRRGYKEGVFQKSIENIFGDSFTISGDIRINTGLHTRPYEPDIALIGKVNRSLRIDIEIDEPYAGITRQPTHCKGNDTLRDLYFTDRGWIVIRFSEYQVHMFEKECLRFISEVINGVIPIHKIPVALLGFKMVEKEITWDVLQAQKWERIRFRENYLMHEFEYIEALSETAERSLNNQEQDEEELVQPTFIGIIDDRPLTGFNSVNIHPRDKRICFYPEPHIYEIDNIPFPSASTVISKFFPEFDAYDKASKLSPNNPLFGLAVEEIVAIWKARGTEAANKGTYLHEQIEKYYLGEQYDSVEEFQLFEQFIFEHPGIMPYRSEWRVFDEEYQIAGTIDLISKNENNYDIYDWKRSKKVVNVLSGEPIDFDRWGRVGLGQLRDIDDTSYNRYCLQQSTYRYILEKNYGLNVRCMFIVILHPDNEKYYKVKVPYQKDRIEYILKALRD